MRYTGLGGGSMARYLINNEYRQNPKRYGGTHLFQIGRRYCEPNELVRAHLHDDILELTVVTGGSATVVTNGEECVFSSGDIHLCLPYDIHEIRVDRGEHLDYDFLSFFLDEGPLNDALESLVQNCRSGKRRIFKDGKIASLVKHALRGGPLRPFSPDYGLPCP